MKPRKYLGQNSLYLWRLWFSAGSKMMELGGSLKTRLKENNFHRRFDPSLQVWVARYLWTQFCVEKGTGRRGRVLIAYWPTGVCMCVCVRACVCVCVSVCVCVCVCVCIGTYNYCSPPHRGRVMVRCWLTTKWLVYPLFIINELFTIIIVCVCVFE